MSPDNKTFSTWFGLNTCHQMSKFPTWLTILLDALLVRVLGPDDAADVGQIRTRDAVGIFIQIIVVAVSIFVLERQNVLFPFKSH